MANLTVTAADVALVVGDSEHQFTGPAAEAISAGQYVRLNTSSGKIALGNGTSAAEVGYTRGIALMSAAANEALTMATAGAIVDLGDALDALAFDAAVYVSDTDGTLADAAGTTSSIVGRVVPGFAATTPDKLLKLV